MNKIDDTIAEPAAAAARSAHFDLIRTIAGMLTWRDACESSWREDGGEASGMTLEEAVHAAQKDVDTLVGDSEQLDAIIEKAREALATPARMWVLELDCHGDSDGDELHLCESERAARQLADAICAEWVDQEIALGDERPREEIEAEWSAGYSVRFHRWEINRERAEETEREASS